MNCLPTMEETGHRDQGLRRERTSDSTLHDARENSLAENHHRADSRAPGKLVGRVLLEGLVGGSEISPSRKQSYCFWGFQCLTERGEFFGDFGTLSGELEVDCFLFAHILVFIIRRFLLPLG